MELFSSRIKKFLIFSYISENENLQKRLYISGNGNSKRVLIFWGMEFFSPSSKKLFKKIHPWKIPYISGKWNFLALMLRNLLYFLKRKLFLYSWKRKRNFLKSQYITFRARNQIFLIFWEMERSDPKNLNTFFLNFLAPKELNKTFLSFLVPKSLRLFKILWT